MKEENPYELTKAVLELFNKTPGAADRIGKIAAVRWKTKRIPPPVRTSVDQR